MDKSLRALCDALKKITHQLKPQHQALSFLLLIGKDKQGKTTLLRQSTFEHISIDGDRHAEIYYNAEGIILELNESWLNQSQNLLQYTLKQLNRCHRSLKISGIILCMDINELLTTDASSFAEHSKTHTHLLTRFGQGLNYPIDAAIIFTKLDALAGFCEFFQNEHSSDLKKPLGFSLNWATRQGKYLSNYKAQFDHFIETLGQQVIQKMHPARSSIKRTLIREFPLQLASLGRAIQSIVHLVSPQFFRLQAIYFTSGEQGGVSLDRLNRKIQHEYALVVQDKFPQSINHRAYFIEEPLATFQTQTQRQFSKITSSHKWAFTIMAIGSVLALSWMGLQYRSSTQLLDEASKELLTYDRLAGQSGDVSSALYHLTQASHTLEKMHANALYLPTLQQVKKELRTQTSQHLQGNFLPTVLSDLEQTLLDTQQSQAARYQALKTYCMLGDPARFSQKDVLAWFQQHWQALPKESLDKKMALLKQVLQKPLPSSTINQHIVTDIRNYLNALPVTYLYYTLAKDYFPKEKDALVLNGFDQADKAIPIYFTKKGFASVIAELPNISAKLQADNWVLSRQDLQNLPLLLQQAYCYEYVSWWQNILKKSTPSHFQNYQQARALAEKWHQSHTISTLIHQVQQQTSPELNAASSLFNQEIASKFTDLNLMSDSSVRHLTLNINELEKFLTTLSMVNDDGRTAFTITKSRFEEDSLSNPLSALYADARQLPEPVAAWVNQIANDAWFILISDSRNYINQQWQKTIVHDYQTTIAKRYPFDPQQTEEVSITDFERFFSSHGSLNRFVDQYLKPFLDTSQPQWQLKEVNNYVLPISSDMINELIRANVITHMFFPNQSDSSHIAFSLQKLSLDPIVSQLQLSIGRTQLQDTQNSDSITHFQWPEANAKLALKSIEGAHYELEETGPWAFFKMLQKVNVLVDEQDSASLEILFEVNGNSGRYLLKTQNQVNPFIPGVLNGFMLNESIA